MIPPWPPVRHMAFAAIWAAALILVSPPAAEAAPSPSPSPPSVSQPQMDLGQTSFLDGEAGVGGLFEAIGDGTATNTTTDASGHALPGRHGQSSLSFTLHPAYVTGLDLLGGHPGLEFLFPFASVRQDVAGAPALSGAGVGDMTIAPFVQWSDGRLLGRPLSLRLAMQVVAPTGSYSPDRPINMGQNAWQVSPYLAFTWRASQRWEVSGRAIYDWSGRNDRPALAPAASTSQAGDQFTTNLSASYAVADDWRLGVAGYAYRQLRDARFDGQGLRGSIQQDFGLGPGLWWGRGHTSVIATAYGEFETRNRPQGVNAVLRLLQTF